MNQKFNSIEKAFYSDGFQLGMKTIESENQETAMFEAISEMYSTIDNIIESLSEFALKQNQSIDCKKGCSWCCHQPVFALDYELDFLKSFIKKNFNETEREAIQHRAQIKQDKLKSLKKEDLLNSKFPCPLLVDGVCIAYKARPMACRIYLSSNVDTCLKFYKNPEEKNNYPALLDFPMRAGRMMNEGFKAAMKTRGIIAKEFRIEEML